jgi:hypothetical protein
MAQTQRGLEDLFWAILRNFESLALRQYEGFAAPLATPAKREFVQRLVERAPGDGVLGSSPLGAPVRDLVAVATNEDGMATLLLQGLLLERMGQAIYGSVTRNERVSVESRALAASAIEASKSVCAIVPDQLGAAGDGERLFAAFADASGEVLSRMDALGEEIDRVFGEPFGLQFRDIVGEFVASMIPVCTTLGMSRRKVVSHLAGSFMGL